MSTVSLEAIIWWNGLTENQRVFYIQKYSDMTFGNNEETFVTRVYNENVDNRKFKIVK